MLFLCLGAMAAGIVLGRALPRETTAVPSAPVSTKPDRSCETVRAQLASAKAQLGACMAYVSPPLASAPTGAAPVPAAPEGIDAMLATLPEIRARREDATELVYVRYGDGRVRSYLPEEWPPAGGIDGGRVILRKLPDGTWEDYDPPPQIVQMSGVPGPDGLVTLPDGRRVRYVFTDAGAQ